jgi:Spy/CpxP family protein refolding chaperone
MKYIRRITQTLSAGIALASTLWLTSLVRAVEAAAVKQPAAGGRSAHLRERLKETARELNLTREQKHQLKPLIREQVQKLRALRQEKSLSTREKVQKFKAIRREMVPKLKQILTAEQFEKWQAHRARVETEMRKRLRRQ